MQKNSSPQSETYYEVNDGQVEITWYLSPEDGTLVIHIDSPSLPEDTNGPKCRIYLNDYCLHENPTYPGRTNDKDT